MHKLPGVPVDVPCASNIGEEMIANPVRKLAATKLPIRILAITTPAFDFGDEYPVKR